MTTEQATLRTTRGDELVLTLMDFAGQPTTVLLTVADADDTTVPTAEFTIAEAAELRELLRGLLERHTRRVRRQHLAPGGPW